MPLGSSLAFPPLGPPTSPNWAEARCNRSPPRPPARPCPAAAKETAAAWDGAFRDFHRQKAEGTQAEDTQVRDPASLHFSRRKVRGASPRRGPDASNLSGDGKVPVVMSDGSFVHTRHSVHACLCEWPGADQTAFPGMGHHRAEPRGPDPKHGNAVSTNHSLPQPRQVLQAGLGFYSRSTRKRSGKMTPQGPTRGGGEGDLL